MQCGMLKSGQLKIIFAHVEGIVFPRYCQILTSVVSLTSLYSSPHQSQSLRTSVVFSDWCENMFLCPVIKVHQELGASEVFRTLKETGKKMPVFWVVSPCSLVQVHRCFRGVCCLHYQDVDLYCAENTNFRSHVVDVINGSDGHLYIDAIRRRGPQNLKHRMSRWSYVLQEITMLRELPSTDEMIAVDLPVFSGKSVLLLLENAPFRVSTRSEVWVLAARVQWLRVRTPLKASLSDIFYVVLTGLLHTRYVSKLKRFLKESDSATFSSCWFVLSRTTSDPFRKSWVSIKKRNPFCYGCRGIHTLRPCRSSGNRSTVSSVVHVATVPEKVVLRIIQKFKYKASGDVSQTHERNLLETLRLLVYNIVMKGTLEYNKDVTYEPCLFCLRVVTLRNTEWWCQEVMSDVRWDGCLGRLF